MKKETTSGGICFEVLWKKMKNMRIRVTGDGCVCVSAPPRMSDSRIRVFVEQHEPYIKERLAAVESQRRRCYPLSYETGDTFCVQGQRLTLRVMRESRAFAGLNDGELVLCVPPGSHARDIFARWMTRTAKQVFQERLAVVTARFPHLNEREIKISVRNMLTRWGSINTKKHTMSLSVHLLRCETELIDYVITHELCHIGCLNHSARFYKALEAHFPNRQSLDKRLLTYGLVDF